MDAQVFIPINYIFKIGANQKLHSDLGAQVGFRWYTGDMHGHKFPFLGKPRRYYAGINYWYRQRELTRYNGILFGPANTAFSYSPETHYSSVSVAQRIQGGSLLGGVETSLGHRLMLDIQVGVKIFGWRNTYGVLRDPTVQPGGMRESFNFSTTARPGTAGAAIPHVDIALTYLLKP